MNRHHPISVALLVILFSFFSAYAKADGAVGVPPPTCGGVPQQGCPCGKMPVCVISDHEDGFFSQTLLSHPDHSAWEGFGQDGSSDFGAAMYTETQVAAKLAELPCIEPVILNSYYAGTLVVSDEAERTGLTKEIQEAIASGDQERLKELQAQLDKLFEKYGLEDIPWRNPGLAQEQLQNRVLSCATGKVEVRGSSESGKYTLSAEASSPMSQSSGRTFSATSDTPEGGISDLVKQVGKELAQIQQKLFCACQTVTERCVTTNFDLANQESECTRVKDCCGELVKEGPRKVKGLSFGESVKHEQACCSPIARARAGEKIDGMEVDKDDINTLDQIWCPGTWNLRGPDLDCDGIPNAQDDTPRPVGDAP